MSEEEIEKLLKELKDEWGDKIPDPEIFPQQFMYYVKFLKYLQRSRGLL